MERVIEMIRSRLAAYAAREVAREDRPAAAVLIPLYNYRGELHVVLTKRTDRVEHHKGEISFPGGARDPEDTDLVFTALRESHEEIGLLPEHVDVLGRIDDFVTVSGFHVTPYVGALDASVSPYLWRPQAAEVAEVLEVPLSHLLDPLNLVMQERVLNGRASLMEAYRFGEHLIWGATSRMLANFMRVAVPEGLE